MDYQTTLAVKMSHCLELSIAFVIVDEVHRTILEVVPISIYVCVGKSLTKVSPRGVAYGAALNLTTEGLDDSNHL